MVRMREISGVLHGATRPSSARRTPAARPSFPTRTGRPLPASRDRAPRRQQPPVGGPQMRKVDAPVLIRRRRREAAIQQVGRDRVWRSYAVVRRQRPSMRTRSQSLRSQHELELVGKAVGTQIALESSSPIRPITQAKAPMQRHRRRGIRPCACALGADGLRV
jgi:hypothetical protein